MAEKGFGVKEVNLIGASGTPTITSPNNLNLNANNVAISTNVSIGGTLSVTGNVSVGGTLTYEDVTNIDSVGVVTARSGLSVTGGTSFFAGAISAAGGITGTATTATNITVTANNTANETVYPLFSDGASGSQGAETDTGLTYNPSTNLFTAGSFSGGGANLTSLPAGQLTGTVADARISTLTASKLSGALPAISGANLTNLNGSNIASGTVADARISTLTASKLSGALPAISGASLTNIPEPDEAPVVDFTVTANGSSAYRFSGGGVDSTADDPDLYLIRGQKYRFNNTTGSSHPFQFRATTGGSAYTAGVSGDQNGVQFFTPDYDAPSKIYYICTLHSNMVGTIYIRGASGANENVGVTTFSEVVETGPKTITGGNNLAIQNFKVKGVWSGSPSIGKSIELISGYDSAVKMAAVGYNLTDVNTGSTYGGDITFHTQPLYSSPTTPLPVRMRISSSGYVTKPAHPAFHASRRGGNVSSNNYVVFDQVDNNNGSHYNNSDGKFTAPVAGIYFFAAWHYTGGTSAFALRINGSQYGEYAWSDDGGHASWVASMTVGQYAQIYTQGYTWRGTAGYHNGFCGYLIG